LCRHFDNGSLRRSRSRADKGKSERDDGASNNHASP
jgi:hypothetical protein